MKRKYYSWFENYHRKYLSNTLFKLLLAIILLLITYIVHLIETLLTLWPPHHVGRFSCRGLRSPASSPPPRSARAPLLLFLIGGSAPCSASATPPVLVSLAAVSQELLTQPQPTCAGLRGVAPGSTPLPPPRARKIILRNRGVPSCGAPTPQATPLPRYFVGAALPVEHPAVPKFLLFHRGFPPLRSPA